MIVQENCNKIIAGTYSQKTKNALGMLSENEISFELVEVKCLQFLKIYCYFTMFCRFSFT